MVEASRLLSHLEHQQCRFGTAYLFCAEAKISPLYREALKISRDNQTLLTNLITGRSARSIVNRLIKELGPMSHDVPQFPLAAALAPLRSKSESLGSGDFSPFCQAKPHISVGKFPQEN